MHAGAVPLLVILVSLSSAPLLLILILVFGMRVWSPSLSKRYEWVSLTAAAFLFAFNLIAIFFPLIGGLRRISTIKSLVAMVHVEETADGILQAKWL